MPIESILPNKNLRQGSGSQRYLAPMAFLGLILLLGAGLRFYDLGTESYWIDEVDTVFESQQSIPQLFASGRLDQPPAYYVPFHFWVRFFGTAEVSTRSFSALVGIGSILLIYIVGRELFGKSAGLLSAFLMAISEFQISFSQETRFYCLFESMTLLSFLFFILALRSNRIIHFAFYGLVSILMIYSHTFGVFIIVAQNLFLILQIRKDRNPIISWLVCQGLVLLAILPDFFLLFLTQSGLVATLSSNMSGNPIPSLLEPLHTVYRFIMPLRRELNWNVFIAYYVLVGTLLVAGSWFCAIRQGKGNLLAAARGVITDFQQVPDDLTAKLLLVSCWLVCPILLPFILSMLMGNFYADRYTISAAPALYLLLGFGIYNVHKLVPVAVSLVALVILIVPSLGQYYTNDVNEQWREAASYVDKNTLSDETIVFAPEGTNEIYVRSFNWYYRGTLPSCGLKGDPENLTLISEALMQCVSGHKHFWVIKNKSPGFVDPYGSFFFNPNQTAMLFIKEQQFVGVSVYLFELRK
jgi:mannosyltransferase